MTFSGSSCYYDIVGFRALGNPGIFLGIYSWLIHVGDGERGNGAMGSALDHSVEMPVVGDSVLQVEKVPRIVGDSALQVEKVPRKPGLRTE